MLESAFGAKRSFHSLTIVLLLCSLGGNIALVLERSPGFADFIAFHAAGTIVRSTERTQLYRRAKLMFVEMHTVGGQKAVVPYEHPPFEAVLFVPLSYLPIRVAFAVWGIFSAAFLLLTCQVFLSSARSQGFSLQLAILCFAIFPSAATIIQGQDSALLLLILTIALVEMDRGADAWAGVFLALSLFRFQYAIPMAIIFAMQKRWRLLEAFGGTAASLGALSLAMVGTQGLWDYWHLMPSISQEAAWRMPSLRGLVDSWANMNSHTSLAIVLFFSVLLLSWSGTQRQNDAGVDFSIALIVALLVSYHLYVYDLVLLLLPTLILFDRRIACIRWSGPRALILFILAMAILLPPLYLMLLPHHLLYLLFWPILLFGYGFAKEMKYTLPTTNGAVTPD